MFVKSDAWTMWNARFSQTCPLFRCCGWRLGGDTACFPSQFLFNLYVLDMFHISYFFKSTVLCSADRKSDQQVSGKQRLTSGPMTFLLPRLPVAYVSARLRTPPRLTIGCLERACHAIYCSRTWRAVIHRDAPTWTWFIWMKADVQDVLSALSLRKWFAARCVNVLVRDCFRV